jgi:hypothetical protein
LSAIGKFLTNWKIRSQPLRTRVTTALTPKGTKRIRWFLPFIPLVLLAIDIAVFPVLIETSDPDPEVSGVGLLTESAQYLGNYKAHRVYVSLDDIDDPDYLPFITQHLPDGRSLRDTFRHSNTALAVSITPQGEGWGSVELTRILRKVSSLSVDDHDGVIDLVRNATPSENVLWYDFKSVSSTSPSTAGMPLDHLVILRIPDQQRSAYSAQIREMLETAETKHLSTLVLPCLVSASLVENANTLTCAATYEALFQALEPGSPLKIFLSLDKNWPTETISHEVEVIKGSWKSAITRDEKTTGPTPTLYQSDLRLMLLFLPVCLMVGSLFKELTFTNYVIICLLFGGAGFEIPEKVTPLISELAESAPAWIGKCLVLAIMSVLLAPISRLDVEGIFKKQHGNTP